MNYTNLLFIIDRYFIYYKHMWELYCSKIISNTWIIKPYLAIQICYVWRVAEWRKVNLRGRLPKI